MDTRTWRSRDSTGQGLLGSGAVEAGAIACTRSFVLREVRQALLQQEIKTGGVDLLHLPQPLSRGSRGLHRHCPEASKRNASAL